MTRGQAGGPHAMALAQRAVFELLALGNWGSEWQGILFKVPEVQRWICGISVVLWVLSLLDMGAVSPFFM